MPDLDYMMRAGLISPRAAEKYGLEPMVVPDTSLGQRPVQEAVANVAGAIAKPWLRMAAYPGQVFAAGMRGEAPSVEEMVPQATEMAQGMVGLGSPFAARGALGAAGGALFTPEGLPIKGSAFTKQSQRVLGELAKEPKGTGPVDLATQAQIPEVPQTGLERYTPPRGVSKRLQEALDNPDVIEGVRQSIKDGMEMGAHRWYHTEPIRQAFAREFRGSNSDPGGAKAFKQFMDLVAATSPRSDASTNIRNASYYYNLARRGEDLPEKLPYPYGHMAQALHRQNVSNLSAAAARGEGGWNVLQNPKPASFSENLQGNLMPGTIDTHAFRNVAMRTEDPRFLATSVRSKLSSDPGEASMVRKYGEIDPKDPTFVTFRPRKLFNEGKLSMQDAKNIPSFWDSVPLESEYAALEHLYRRLGAEHGLPTADAQAAAWAGGGKLTGLGSPPTHTFPELFNQRVEYTARMRGERPQSTLSKLIRGEAPLLGLGGLLAGGAYQGTRNQ